MVDQLTLQIDERTIDELNPVTCFSAEVLDAGLIVKVAERVDARSDSLGYLPFQTSPFSLQTSMVHRLVNQEPHRRIVRRLDQTVRDRRRMIPRHKNLGFDFESQEPIKERR